MQRLGIALLAAVLALVLPGTVRAQDVGSGAFAGVVRDASGAVLPGVTVEAASPELIEKVRIVVTDDQGRYRIAGLRPGVYSVTFTLTGFRGVRREGLDLTTGFIATVDAELSVGSVEETITVTGEAPLVDTRNSLQQRVFSGEVVRELPLGKNAAAFVALLPGAVQTNLTSMDVGGVKAEAEAQMGIHGGRPNDALTFREGTFDGHMFGGFGPNAVSSINPATVQEVTLQLSGGLTAEAQSGGIQKNVIVRDGGNRLNGVFIGDFSHRNLQGTNIDDALRARGVTTSAFINQNRDLAIGVGGPIKQDRLWFYIDGRQWKAYSEYSGSYYNKVQGGLFYQPDLARPGISGAYTESRGARLTWQASSKNKVSLTYHYDDTCTCYYQLAQGLRSPEAAEHHRYWPYKLAQASWTNPLTGKLLLQAGALWSSAAWLNYASDDQGVAPTTISILDRLRDFRYNASDNYNSVPFTQGNGQASLTYVSGSHTFKVGGVYIRATNETITQNNESITYTFAGTVPESVTLYANPNISKNGVTQSALYAQDQWTINNLTLNLGARLDLFNGWAPATHSPAGRWLAARDYPAVKDTLDWKDVNLRLGSAYKLFGSDNTALKASLGRFIPYASSNSGTAPANQVVLTATRTWRDLNVDYIPQEEELGPLSNANFGKVVQNTSFADDVVRGWHVRPYNWQAAVSIEHELRPGLGVNVGYYRTWYGNFTVTDNALVGPSDYDSYCLPAPADSRLPGGGGGQICGVMALKPASFGQVRNVVSRARHFGDQTETYNGIDVTMSMRLAGGGFLAGGLSTSQTVTDNCDVRAAVPESAGALSAPTLYCHNAPSWSAGTQVKVNGSYPLPWDFRASAVYQNVVGAPTTATYVATNAQVTPILGRPLAGGAGTTASVELIEPKSLYSDGRVNTLSVSVGRSFRVGARNVQPTIDLFNALNANSVLQMNLRYGPSWRNVTSTLPARMIKLRVVVDF